MRALTLYWMNIKAFARKLGYDWARELTTIICGAVIFATFVYVFHDFLNNEVKQISARMFETLAHWGAIAVLVFSSAYLALILKKERIHNKDSISQFAAAQGEREPVIQWFLVLRNSTLLVAGIFLVWSVVIAYLVGEFFQTGLYWQIGSLTFFFLLPTDEIQRRMPKTSLIQTSSPRTALTRWRLLQMLRRNRRSQWALFVSLVLATGQILIAQVNGPLFLHILLGFLSGWLASTAVNAQLSADLKYAWMEKLAGVSHDQFMGAYRAISFFLAIVIFIFTFMMMLLSTSFAFSDLLKVALAASIPLYLAPALSMQIDAHRPVIQMVTGFLVSLFLVTAVFAHYLAVILVPVVEVYAMQQQHNRFYRSV